MKNYYEILGLSATATDREIKYVFRKLAIAYHPDKNSAPEAEAVFKEVNEAYEILGDPVKRYYYDQSLFNPGTSISQEPFSSKHRDPAYRRRRAGYTPPRGPSPLVLMKESFLKYSHFLTGASCLWCILLLIDYTLPQQVSIEQVVTEHQIVHHTKFHSSDDLLVTDKGHHFPINTSELIYFPHHSNIKIFYSPIFSLLIKVENEESSYQLNNLATIYRNFMFAPIVLLILTISALVGRKGLDFRFNLEIVMFLIFLLNIGVFFMSKI
jgi:DnaJ domain